MSQTLKLDLHQEREDALLEPGSQEALLGKDEMNLAEFPFAVLTRYAPENQKTIEILQEGRNSQGKLIRQEWTVTGSDAFGLPTAADEEVYVALMKLLRDSGFRSRTVQFRVADLLRIMNSSTSKRDYERVATALDRLTGVMIRSRNAFWDHAQQRHVTEAFHLLEGYRLNTGSGNRAHSEVTFSEFLFASICSGYVKNLDISFYFQLSTPLGRRIYRLLDKHRYRGRVYEIEIKRFAAKLPVHDPYLSQLKRRFAPVFEELIQRGYLATVSYRPGMEDKTILRVEFAQTDEITTATENAISPLIIPEVLAPSEQDNPLLESLIEAGVSKAAATQLLEDFPAEKVALQLGYLPYSQDVRNPGGYLRRAIEGDFAPPPGWLEAQKPKKARKTTRMAKESSNGAEGVVGATEEAVEAIKRLLQETDPIRWEQIYAEATKRIAPPVSNRPDGRVYQAALASNIRQVLSEQGLL